MSFFPPLTRQKYGWPETSYGAATAMVSSSRSPTRLGCRLREQSERGRSVAVAQWYASPWERAGGPLSAHRLCHTKSEREERQSRRDLFANLSPGTFVHALCLSLVLSLVVKSTVLEGGHFYDIPQMSFRSPLPAPTAARYELLGKV